MRAKTPRSRDALLGGSWVGIGVGVCRITWEVVFFSNPQIEAQLRMTKAHLGEEDEGGLCSGLNVLKVFQMIIIYLPSSSFEKSCLTGLP